MKVTSRLYDNTVWFYPEGEIDECSVPSLRREVDGIIDRNATAQRAVFNLAGIRFMDSTGIGFLIGRYKKLKRYDIAMYIENPNLTADKVLSVSGVYNLIPKL
ncbi:MAG: STAS domain-containing protein [Clostridia bacterium]|nr:STAS domain-containing protein [Clostridia bacterium]